MPPTASPNTATDPFTQLGARCEQLHQQFLVKQPTPATACAFGKNP